MLNKKAALLLLLAFALAIPLGIFIKSASATGTLYVFFGTYDENTALFTNINTTITINPSNGTPYNITIGGGNPYQNVALTNGTQDNFRIWLSNNMSRYYYPISRSETIYIFTPATPYYIYYVTLFDSVGVTNAYVESYVYLNGTSFVIERQPYTQNNKMAFVLTQFGNYGFRLVCDQGTIDFGRRTAEDPTIIPAFSFTVTPLHFASQPITYGSLTLSATRMNDTWIQVQYYDSGNKTTSLNVTIADESNGGQTVYSDMQNTTQTYSLDYYDAVARKDYLLTIIVVHQTYGTLTWQLPCSSISYNLNPFIGLSMLGAFPFDISQFIAFIAVLCVFSLFSARDHHIGLIVAMIVAGLFASPPVHWLGIPMTSVVTFLCFAILYALGRRKPT